MSFIHLLLCLSFYWVRCFVFPCIEYPSSECNMRTNMGSDLVPTLRASFLFVPPHPLKLSRRVRRRVASVGYSWRYSFRFAFNFIRKSAKNMTSQFLRGPYRMLSHCASLIYRLVYSRYIYVYDVATSWSRQAEQLEISNLLCRLCRAYLIYRDSSGRSGLIPVLHRSEFLFWTLYIFNY